MLRPISGLTLPFAIAERISPLAKRSNSASLVIFNDRRASVTEMYFGDFSDVET